MRFLHTEDDPRLEGLKGRGCFPLSLASIYDRDPLELLDAVQIKPADWRGSPKEVLAMSMATHPKDLIPFAFHVVDTAIRMVATQKIVGSHVVQLVKHPAPMGTGLIVATLGMHQVGHVAAFHDGMLYDANERAPITWHEWLKHTFFRDIASYVAFHYLPPSLNTEIEDNVLTYG